MTSLTNHQPSKASTEAGTNSKKLIYSYRLRIALWFAVLSSLVYLTMTVGAAVFFYARMNYSLDSQLRVLASELGHAIDVKEGKPYFRDWARTVQTEPARSLGPIELFDSHGQLIEFFGQPGPKRLIEQPVPESGANPHRWRLRSTPLMSGKLIVGYLQIGLPVLERDQAIHDLLVTVAIFGPLVILGLGASSYYVAGKAAAPLEANIGFLKRFVIDAGHELNTPLSISQARLDNFRKKAQKSGADVSFRDLDVLGSSLERMSRIVADLLLLAQMEANAMRGHTQHIHLSTLRNSLSQEFGQMAEEKHIRLELSFEAGCLVANEMMVFRLLRNLVENALKYTDEGGEVAVSVKKVDNAVSLTVSDTGAGIPEESLQHIFDRFYRVDQSRTRNSGGSGLGLSIVKAIVDSHKGSISVRSKVGGGTTFSVLLPNDHADCRTDVNAETRLT